MILLPACGDQLAQWLGHVMWNGRPFVPLQTALDSRHERRADVLPWVLPSPYLPHTVR